LLLIVSAHSATGITLSHSPAKFIAPLMGLSPLGDDCEPTILLGFSPIGVQCLYALLMGLSPTRRRHREQPHIAPLSISLRTVKTLHCGLVPHSEFLLYYMNFLLSEPPVFACSADGITSTRRR